MVNKALTPTTHVVYDRARDQYCSFVCNHLNRQDPFPASVDLLMLFLAHYYEKGMAASTVRTYVSTLSYYHRINDMPDPTQVFIVKKCLQGYSRSRVSVDCRKPITLAELRKIVLSLTHTTNSHFLRVMLKAMYLLAFHALLRIGEFTLKTSSKVTSILKRTNVNFQFGASSSLPTHLEVFLSGYKHSHGHSTTLLIQSNVDTLLCPVKALWTYLSICNSIDGPLFTFMDGSLVTCSFFTKQLNLSLQWAGLDTKMFKSHSFRIGYATTAASQGISDDVITRIGRWKSSAMKDYVLLPVLKL